MCFGATCPTCSRKSWRGCGAHIPAALSGVPEDQWCTCEPRVDVDGKSYPPAAKVQISAPSWLRNLMGGQKGDDGKGEL